MSNTSLVNKSIYYWDLYLVHGDKDNLAAAVAFMKDYRKTGGQEYKETEIAMNKHVENLINNTDAPENK